VAGGSFLIEIYYGFIAESSLAELVRAAVAQRATGKNGQQLVQRVQ
jgi:hypothetical protein